MFYCRHSSPSRTVATADYKANALKEDSKALEPTRWALVLSAFLCESLRNWSIVERGTLRANESAVALAGTARRSRAQLGARGLAGL